MLGGRREDVVQRDLLLEVPHEGKSAKVRQLAERSLLGVVFADVVKISLIISPPVEMFFRGFEIPNTKA